METQLQKNIKHFCKVQGITLQTLADRIGVTYNTLNQQSRVNPSLSSLERIAKGLNIEVWELLRPSPEEPQQQQEQTKIALNYIICPHCKQSIKLNPE